MTHSPLSSVGPAGRAFAAARLACIDIWPRGVLTGVDRVIYARSPDRHPEFVLSGDGAGDDLPDHVQFSLDIPVHSEGLLFVMLDPEGSLMLLAFDSGY